MKQPLHKQPSKRFVKKPIEHPYDLEFSEELMEDDCKMKTRGHKHTKN